jgi:hypothetical protein
MQAVQGHGQSDSLTLRQRDIMHETSEFYAVIVGNSMQLESCLGDRGRLDEATAKAKALRLAKEQTEPVYVLKVTRSYRQVGVVLETRI